jgi:hypothetical protein
MAEFSKQYCELHDPHFTPDFDILEIAESLDPDHYTPIICEGFGFLAIGKKEDGSIILAFRPKSGNMEDEIIWKSYNEVINGKS